MTLTTILLAGLLISEVPDTLQAVTVVADRGVVVSRTDTLSVNSSRTVSEFLLQSPGAYVADYGGYAALKTVSIRGMGSPHTAIYIDGVRVGDVQSGQRNIGAYGLDSFSSAVIDYAQNSLSFTTSRPSFIENRRVGGYARFSAGSFGTYLPAARIDWKVSEKLTLSANASAVFSKGNYSYGDGLFRENNDIKELRGSVDMFGILRGGKWHAKVWGHSSERGAPGSVSWPSTDRQKDKNFFAQGLLNKQFNSLYHLTASTKISYDDIYYSSSWGDSQYGQTEAQLNSSHKFNIFSWLTLSATADIYYDGLKSTNCNQQRIGTTEAFSASFRSRKLSAVVAIQYDGVFDMGQRNWNKFSPSLDLKYFAFKGFEVVAFARRAYRVPTFDELYYVGYGNPELNPEDAILTDIGINWKKRFGAWNIKTMVDGYYNYLHNKINSAPSEEDPNIWHPYNIGRVRSAGVDALVGFDFSSGGWLVSLSAKYGYQDAVDKTPGSSTFNQQIDYVAKHNLAVNAAASIKGWSVESDWNLRSGRRDINGEMPDWNTLDIFLKKSFNLGKAGIPALKFSFKNITDNRYELSSGYPMPGFNFTGGLEYVF